jgi:hypothetical protein
MTLLVFILIIMIIALNFFRKWLSAWFFLGSIWTESYYGNNIV